MSSLPPLTVPTEDITGANSGKETGWPAPGAQRRKGRELWELAEDMECPLGFLLARGLGLPQLLTYQLSGILDFWHEMTNRVA